MNKVKITKILMLIVAHLLVSAELFAVEMPKFSTAGFYELPNMGRNVYSMNLAWRFIKDDVKGEPFRVDFDDSKWEVVSIPHGLELLPVEASGCLNYQGVAWYRKRFVADPELKGKELFLHFEAIMGKSEIYINGELVKRHYGGYLPIILDVSGLLKFGEENLIAVKADNSDDTTYPVGKNQSSLDFTYFGGIYRDCWLVSHNNIFITNSNYEDEVAGGGLFVWYGKVSDELAEVNIKTHIRNSSDKNCSLIVQYEIKDRAENLVKTASKRLNITKGRAAYVENSVDIVNPKLWSPKSPNLYYLDITVKDKKGNILDGYRQRIGVRSIEFKEKEGFWLNGKPYEGKIMGTNRHQDFAVIGNAVPNSLQWRDAKKLRDAGMEVIRSHYVLDPAFMDACDELGLFALVEVPGWQYWNKKNPIFGERVYSDIRNMVRIHRNHGSLFFWEPILNETSYPADFAKNAREICDEEYPYPYSYAACDDGAAGDQYFDLLLRPKDILREGKTYFIREWGDNVDDWNSQNSDSRVSREWGEMPMIVQAQHYAKYNYLPTNFDLKGIPVVPTYDDICNKPAQIIGGSFWHSFDHQRGYQADPFYGGIMDGFRQPKYSYYMFMAQRPSEKIESPASGGAMVYIAHEATPFSPRDVTVYSNCDQVRLTLFKDGKEYIYNKDPDYKGMPSPIITFKNIYNFMDWKYLGRKGRRNDAYILAEGIIDGKVVATHKRNYIGQADKIILRLDDDNVPLTADGSDVVTLIAEIADRDGNVKRLNNSQIHFTIEGEGRILGDAITGTNPTKVEWGSAPVLIQSTNKAGKIKVVATMAIGGENRPNDGVIEFESLPNKKREIFSPSEILFIDKIKVDISDEQSSKNDLQREILRLQKEINQIKVKEVEAQQTLQGVGLN